MTSATVETTTHTVATSEHRPSPQAGLAARWLRGWEAFLEETALSWLYAAQRAPRPLAAWDWLQLLSERRPPRWASRHRLAFETPLARLRDFTPAGARDTLPVLVLPPQAGHDSCIVDYSPQQSQMQAVIDAGLERAAALDWVGASAHTAGSTIDDYLEVVDRAVEHLGGRVNLIGDCQGGWLATIYAALEPKRVNTLTIAGAPIDFHAGDPVIGELLQLLAPEGNLAFYRALVALAGGVLPGRQILRGFIAINPADEISRQLALARHLDDPGYVARYREFEDWFKHTQDIAGSFYLWIVRHLFLDNELVAGKLEVGGRRVDLTRLTMPLALLAGAEDHITPPPQVFALAEHAAADPAQVVSELASGGHLGLFMGHEALSRHWPPILAAILRHSA